MAGKFGIRVRINRSRQPLWRGSLLPLGCEAVANPVHAVYQWNPVGRFWGASHPNGSKLPRHKSASILAVSANIKCPSLYFSAHREPRHRAPSINQSIHRSCSHVHCLARADPQRLSWGGGLIVAHLGLIHTAWIGGLVVLVALALTAWSGRLDRVGPVYAQACSRVIAGH